MKTLQGRSFEYMFNGELIKFTITRDYHKAVRVIINNTIQAIWIPKTYFCIRDDKLLVGTLDWKLKTKEFQKKLKMSRSSMQYPEHRLKYINAQS